MSVLQPFLIAGSDVGMETDKKSFLLPDQAFPTLENAYVWRDRVKKREGIKFLGRLRRALTAQALGNNSAGATTTIANIFTTIGITNENPEIEAGSLVITVAAPDANVFTDDGDGTFTVTGSGVGTATGSFINYATGEVVLAYSGAGATGGAAMTAAINYFPGLPCMGIIQRETGNINFESTIIFDTVYAYIFDGSKYTEFLGAAAQTWNGSDSEFFWGTNYRGSDASVKFLFVTNFNNDALSPMRFTNGTTWTDFQPAISGTLVTNEAVGNLNSPWTSFPSTDLDNTPVIPGTVTITVSNSGTNPDVIFTDPANDGTLKGSANTNSGTINYTTGAIALTISPAMTADATVIASYQFETTFMFTARILISYYGRLLAFDTFEGATIGAAKQFYNRCRFSQVGDPTQTGAWVSTTFGKGGFIDAPTNEEIISAIFFKNTLIVYFEKTTWQLRYVGDYGLPFIWERISSDFGCESQFSTVLFDDGVLGVGNRAIVGATAQSVSRIDLKIPDQVFSFRNDNEGKQRIHAARDFQKEVVYWCYNDATDSDNAQKYPNKVLLYNYRNDTYAVYRSSVTAFGTYEDITGITWDSTDVFWDDEISWDDPQQVKEFPFVVSGNQQGFIHKYGYESRDDFSLSITAIDRTVTPPTLEIKNHNFLDGDIIFLTDLNFIDTSDSSDVTTNLNDNTYRVNTITVAGVYDADNIQITKWNSTSQQYEENFSYTPASGTGTYIGEGKAALVPLMRILTKDFNPYASKGKQIKISYIDFLTDVTGSGVISVKLFANSAITEEGELLVGQATMETQQNPLFPTQQLDIYWNRFFTSTYGQMVSVEITYNDDQINEIDVVREPFVLNGMILWSKEGGRIVF